MSSKDLLLEVGCEEIPARFMPGALEQLKEKCKTMLKENRLKYGEVETYGTPRRLILLVKELSTRQEEIREKIKGPSREHAYDAEGNPTRAALGFSKSAGVEVDRLQIEEIKGTAYVMAIKKTPGEATEKLLPGLMISLLHSLRFPRSMFWQRKEVRFPRPIRWLLCLFEEEVVPFEYAGLSSGRTTWGHRFLEPGPYEIREGLDYFQKMENAYVILDQTRRKESIRAELKKAAGESQGYPRIKEELLDEVTFLVEYPVIIRGEFSREYLELPQEVLITTMEVHQRYFPVLSSSHEIMPFFLGVSNNLSGDYTRKGYQKVLQARLADAGFFYREDRKKSLEEYVPDLKDMLFQENLGTLYDKTQRIMELVRLWGSDENCPSDEVDRAVRAAYLSKADLLTSMVYEFPELQGVMGKEYGEHSGEDKRVARAIREHYFPRFAGDNLPESTEGILVSLADKMDTLTGCFYAGIQPSGSQDPYALRRQAQGIVSMLLEKALSLSINKLIEDTLEVFGERVKDKSIAGGSAEEIQKSLEEFLEQRVRHIFQEKKLSYDVIETVLAVSYRCVYSVYQKAKELEASLQEGEVQEILEGYTRVNNLARKAEAYSEVDPSLLQEPAEKQLWEKLQEEKIQIIEAIKKENYRQALLTLAKMKPSIDQFFDEVMVMTEKKELRKNRLSLLLELKKLFNLYGEFSLIQSTV